MQLHKCLNVGGFSLSTSLSLTMSSSERILDDNFLSEVWVCVCVLFGNRTVNQHLKIGWVFEQKSVVGERCGEFKLLLVEWNIGCLVEILCYSLARSDRLIHKNKTKQANQLHKEQ